MAQTLVLARWAVRNQYMSFAVLLLPVSQKMGTVNHLALL
jgi:hypothetical protein